MLPWGLDLCGWVGGWVRVWASEMGPPLHLHPPTPSSIASYRLASSFAQAGEGQGVTDGEALEERLLLLGCHACLPWGV